jgi:acetyl-CoA carboxylase carboxyltransferase component
VNVICRKEIQEASDPKETRKRLIEEYQQIFEGPFESARKMYVDDVIRPEETRAKIIQALRIFSDKKASRAEKKHANMPV